MENRPGQKPFRKFRKGSRLKASDLNEIITAIIKQISPGKGIKIDTFGDKITITNIAPHTNPVTGVRMIISSIKNTYLVCDWEGQAITVAKPKGLRKEAEWPSADGQTYVYTTATRRTASQAGETDEEQYITPPYEVGEELLVRRVGNSGIDDDSNNPIRWRDANDGGRCWATRKPEEEFLPLAGGEMAGEIDMSGHAISGAVVDGGTP